MQPSDPSGIIAGGLRQTSNAWGNHPGDNTLTGCNALYVGRNFTDFIAEATIVSTDNDGLGFTFGWQANASDGSLTPGRDEEHRHIAAMINDIWPSPPADGVSGPHMKIRRKKCVDRLLKHVLPIAHDRAIDHALNLACRLTDDVHHQSNRVVEATGHAWAT